MDIGNEYSVQEEKIMCDLVSCYYYFLGNICIWNFTIIFTLRQF